MEVPASPFGGQDRCKILAGPRAILRRISISQARRGERPPAARVARGPEASVDELLEQVGLARAALDDAVEVALEEQHRLHVVERQHLARVCLHLARFGQNLSNILKYSSMFIAKA